MGKRTIFSLILGLLLLVGAVNATDIYNSVKFHFDNEVPGDLILKSVICEDNSCSQTYPATNLKIYKKGATSCLSDDGTNANVDFSCLEQYKISGGRVNLSTYNVNDPIDLIIGYSDTILNPYLEVYYTKGDTYVPYFLNYPKPNCPEGGICVNKINPSQVYFKKLPNTAVAEISRLNIENIDNKLKPIQVTVPVTISQTVCSAYRFTQDWEFPIPPAGDYSDYSADTSIKLDIVQTSTGAVLNTQTITIPIEADTCAGLGAFTWTPSADFENEEVNFNIETDVIDKQVTGHGKDYDTKTEVVYPFDLDGSCWVRGYDFTLSNVNNMDLSTSVAQITKGEYLYALFDAGAWRDNSLTPMNYRAMILFNGATVYDETFSTSTIENDTDFYSVNLSSNILDLEAGYYNVTLVLEPQGGDSCTISHKVVETQNLQIYEPKTYDVTFDVVNSKSEKVSNANINLVLKSADDYYQQTPTYNVNLKTDAQGEAVFTGAIVGDYEYTITHDSYKDVVGQVHVGSDMRITATMYSQNTQPFVYLPESFSEYYKNSIRFNINSYMRDYTNVFSELTVSYSIISNLNGMTINYNSLTGDYVITTTNPGTAILNISVKDPEGLIGYDVVRINFMDNSVPTINSFYADPDNGAAPLNTNFVVNVVDADGGKSDDSPIWDRVKASSIGGPSENLWYVLDSEYEYVTDLASCFDSNGNLKSCDWTRYELESFNNDANTANNPNWGAVIGTGISNNAWFVIDKNYQYVADISSCGSNGCTWTKVPLTTYGQGGNAPNWQTVKSSSIAGSSGNLWYVLDSQYEYVADISSCLDANSNAKACTWEKYNLVETFNDKTSSNNPNWNDVIIGTGVSNNAWFVMDNNYEYVTDISSCGDDGCKWVKVYLHQLDEVSQDGVMCTINFGDSTPVVKDKCSELNKGVSHTYTNPGTYNVRLTADDGFNNPVEMTEQVFVYQVQDDSFPHIDYFNLDSSNGNHVTTDLTLSWQVTHSKDLDMTCTLRVNGAAYPVSCVNNNYVIPGFNLEGPSRFVLHAVEVGDDNDEVSRIIDRTFTREVAPDNNAPVTTLSADLTSGYAPFNVTFTTSATDADGDSLACTFDFGDGTQITRNDCSSFNGISHVYANAGTYTARFWAYDGQVNSNYATQTITVQSTTIAIDQFSATPTTGVLNLTTTLTFVYLNPLNKEVTCTLDWDTNAPNAQTFACNAINEMTHFYDVVGDHPIRVTITDGTVTDQREITVRVDNRSNQVPIVTLNANPTTGVNNLTTTLSLSVSDPDGDPITACELSWGEPGSAPVNYSDCSQINGMNHTYTSISNYDIYVRAYDNQGGVGLGTVTVSVTGTSASTPVFDSPLSLTSSNGQLLPTNLTFTWAVSHTQGLPLTCTFRENGVDTSVNCASGTYTITNYNRTGIGTFTLFVSDGTIVINSTLVTQPFYFPGGANISSLDYVNLIIDDVIEPGEFDFSITTINETLGKRQIDIEPFIICDGVENGLNNGNGKLSSSAISSVDRKEFEFKFKTSTDAFNLLVPTDKVCRFKVVLTDVYGTHIVMSENVMFSYPEEEQQITSIRGKGTDIVEYMGSTIAQPINTGYNSIQFNLVNNEPESKELAISMMSASLGIDYNSEMKLASGQQRSVSMPLYISKSVKPGMYPVRYSVRDGSDKQVRYSYIKVTAQN